MSGAAAAAAAAKRRAQGEEESMSGYTPGDLAEGWEFKILRSAPGSFRDPVKMRDALEQEGRAGWVLLEKFDNQRLRLKRPASAKAGDAGLGFDPYRTNYGIGEAKFAILLIGTILSVVAVVLVTIMLVTRAATGHP